jgi:hypothetical protein
MAGGGNRRPNLSRAVRLLIRDIARREPAFRHVQADRILVMAGEARRASHASIRPLRFADTGTRRSPDGRRLRPRVLFRGREILYVITLRPPFFRALTPSERVGTVLHELFHMSAAFDGTLDPARRHAALPEREFAQALAPLVTRYLARCPARLLARLAFHGEVLVRQWLEKPGLSYPAGRPRGRAVYREDHTFLGSVEMITRPTSH